MGSSNTRWSISTCPFVVVFLLIISCFFGSLCMGDSDDCKDGKCDLYSSSGYRLQFLGGLNSEEDEMCYKYKLHEYRHKKGLKKRERIDNDTITISMKICNNDNANGIVSDYLTKVNIVNNTNNDKDYYYIDNTHFYYVSYNNNNSDEDKTDPIIELCFSNGENDNVKIVTETDYCIKHNNGDELCSNRGIFISDICGLDSISKREEYDLPPSDIDYIPIAGQLYNVRKSSHMRDQSIGRGTFELHSSLVVIRGWWIDECIVLGNNKEVELTINDDYFDEIISNNININSFDDLIDSPLILPIYDHYIVSTQCHSIDGIILNYNHDILNEKLTLIIDIENVNPLIFFNEANFRIDKMNAIKMHDDDEFDSSSRRSLLGKTKKLKWTKTIDLPIDGYDTEHDIYYKPKAKNKNNNNNNNDELIKIGTCEPNIQPYASLTIGFGLKFKIEDIFNIKLKEITGKLGFEFGIDASLKCTFGEESEDGTIDWELFSKEKEFGKYKTTIGPVLLTTKPYVTVSAVVTRPALQVTLEANGHASSSFEIVAGYSSSNGAFANVDHTLDFHFGIEDPIWNGMIRLGAEFAVIVTPGLKFGVYNTDILRVGAPLELPYIKGEMSSVGSCGSNNVDIKFGVDLGLSVNIEIGVEKIKLFGIKIFNGMTWSPDEPLFKLPISFEPKDIGCQSKDNIDSITLYEYNYDNHIYQDSPFVFVATWGSEWQDRVTIDQANAYCSLKYDSSLATIDSTKRYGQVRDLYFDYRDNEWDGDVSNYNSENEYVNKWYPLLGLNDLDDDGVYTWLKDDSVASYQLMTDFHDYNDGGLCTTFGLQGPTGSKLYYIEWPCEDRQSFVCDLYNITYEYDRYIGVYTYDSNLTWSEANDWCNDTFGTELATILSDTQNDNAWQTIYDIKQEHPHVIIRKNFAWIGMGNITDWNNFVFQDGRDYYTTEYTNWDTNEPSSGQTVGYFDYDNTNKKWRNSLDGVKVNAFICNRPNYYSVYKHDNYIAIEAQNYGLNWEEANEFCQNEFDTQLASIHTTDEYNSINTMLNELGWDVVTKDYKVWIGLTDNENEGNYIWADGTIYDSNNANWASSQHRSDEDCVVLRLSESNNEWHDYNCEVTFERFLCNRDKTVFEYKDYIGINTHNDDILSLSYTWDEAETYCQTHYGTNLASIHSSSQADMIEYIFNETDANPSLWIGLNDIDNEGTYVYSDGSSYDYSDSWYSGQPNNVNGNQNCIDIYIGSGTPGWTDYYCDTKYTAFICNRPATYYETEDFIGVHLRNTDTVDWANAQIYCDRNFGTHLASILDDDQNDQAMELFEIFDGDVSMWIGLWDLVNEDSFVWIDDNSYSLSLFDPSPWSSNQPDDWQNNEDCVELWDDAGGLWNDRDCLTKLNAFICNKPPTIYEDHLYVGVNLHNEVRYTWEEANDHCKVNYDGATLATNIVNDWRYAKIQEIMGAITSNHAFIGFSDTDSEGIYKWEDGSGTISTSSSYWCPGQPNNADSGQDCGDFYLEYDTTYCFTDTECDREIGAFICNHDYYVVRYGDYIGVHTDKYGNERLTFNEAENYCNEHYGTHLASIHNQDSNDELIYIYDAIADIRNWGTYMYIGLYDENNNNNFEWTDGTNYNYTANTENSWSSGNDCVAFVSNIGRWRYVSCDDDRPSFVCNAN